MKLNIINTIKILHQENQVVRKYDIVNKLEQIQ